MTGFTGSVKRRKREVLELLITLELPDTEDKEKHRERALELHRQFAETVLVEVWGGPF